MQTKPAPDSGLVDASGLLDRLFDASSRPSLRWLRYQQQRRAIPFYVIGRLVRFDPDEVREALRKNLKVEARS